jgi:hypothetical protein
LVKILSSPDKTLLSSGELPIVVIACKVFQSLIAEHLSKDPSAVSAQTRVKQVTFMDYGLHRVPSNLTRALQAAIDGIEEPSLVVLGYGLCGNGLDGIKAGEHTLLIPRADDCIAILLGSYRKYIQEFEETPGTYYLTKGWLESGSNPLQEYQEYVEKYGQESATWIMDQQYQHYERLVFVAHNQRDLEKYRPQAREVARYCERWGMRYEEILGSDGYVRALIEVAAELDKANYDDFVIIPPGGEIRQSQFIR